MDNNILCLLVLRPSVAFKETSRLFQIYGAIWESVFCPWLEFRKGWFSLRKDALLLVLGWPARLKTSLIYAGLLLLKNLKVSIWCIVWRGHLWEASKFSQIRLNLCGPYYSNSNKNEYICCSLFFRLLFKLGYQAKHA